MSFVPVGYVEIPVTDLAAAKTFYGQLFGWKFEDFHSEYTGFFHGEGHGGFQRVETVTRGGALVVLEATDFEGMKDRVRETGAEITKEEMLFPGGRRFQFLDPSGNELAVWVEEQGQGDRV
ncbi:MAG: hypothetical protein CME19_05485 [Gemmatimonadetes bacterium]|nr:hypothetical protein [Gemmatimonadota bacterium]|tara:strand:+ start:786 stop:1148 length:363 start_codon:yes stop_codon:yes gene_type:complete